MEVWLKPNRRVLIFGIAFGLVVLIGGVLLLVLAASQLPWRIVGSVTAIAGAWIVAVLTVRFGRPRLACDDEQLLVYAGPRHPTAVPLEFVECIFLGESDLSLPGSKATTKVASIVVRLADRAVDFKHRAISPALGKWEGGYIMIRGIWCERLSLERLNRLNERLAKSKRTLAERRASRETAAEP